MTDKNIIAETLIEYNKIAMIEINLGNYEKAIETFKKSYFIENELDLFKEKAQTLVNIANAELLLDTPEQALKSVTKALNIFKKTHANKDYLTALLLKGTIYFMLADIKKAEQTFSKVIHKSINDDISGEAYYLLFEVHIKSNSNHKSQESITKAIMHFERSKNDNRLKQALQSRADFFTRLNRADLATMDLNRINLLDSNNLKL